MENIPGIARIISDPSWRVALEKMRPWLRHEYEDYSDPKQKKLPTTDKIFLAELSLTDVYKILDDFNLQNKKTNLKVDK